MLENNQLYDLAQETKPYYNNNTLSTGLGNFIQKWIGAEQEKPILIIPQTNEDFGNYAVICLKGDQPQPDEVPEALEKVEKELDVTLQGD